MKRRLSLFVLCTFANTLLAQHITHHFHDVSMTEALQYIQSQTRRYDINFIANELEDFRVTTEVKNKSVTDAILQVAGLYPIRVVRNDERKIYVECTHKTNRHLRGRLVDESNSPVAFANIALLSPTDSTLLGGGVSNENGDFVIPYERPTVLARISFVGYKTIYRLCSSEHIGTIRMQTEAYTIKGVVVKGDIPQYQMTTGGLTVDIQNSLLRDVGTADDVLSMLPQVQGSDGNFTVFSKGTPVIYINNKKVQNTQELKQLKSTDIRSVDIITSPGAKYNAEVGAVIHINTKKRQGNGISVEAYSQVKYNKKWTTYNDATVRYHTGGLEVFGYMMINNGNHAEDNTITAGIRANGNGVNIVQVCPNNFWYTMLGGQFGASYDFNEHNSIGFSYNLSGSLYEGGTAQTQQTITRNKSLEGYVKQSLNMNVSEKPWHEVNIYYVGKVGRLGIDFNGSWIWKKLIQDYASFETSPQLGDRDVHTYSVNRNNMLAGKLMLTYPIWKGELSIGSEVTRSNSHGVYDNVERVVSPSDDKIRESNIAGFAEYQMKLGVWRFSGGLRYESVNSDYYSFGEHQSEPSRKYHDLFPNLSVGWQKDKCDIQLNYNKRISRPSFRWLNTNVQYNNRYTHEGGNPLLRPTIKQDIDLNVTYSWLIFSAGYSHSKDFQLHYADLYQEGKETVFWTNRNFDKYESYKASLTASPKFGFYSPTLTLSYWQQNFDTQAYGLTTRFNKPQFEINLRNWLTIGKTTKAMLYLHSSTSYDYGFTHLAHEFYINTRVQKTFFDGNLTVALFANDIFRSLRTRWTAYFPVTTMSKDAYTYTQYIGVSLSYQFNTTRSKYKGTGAGNEEKSRL